MYINLFSVDAQKDYHLMIGNTEGPIDWTQGAGGYTTPYLPPQNNYKPPPPPITTKQPPTPYPPPTPKTKPPEPPATGEIVFFCVKYMFHQNDFVNLLIRFNSLYVFDISFDMIIFMQQLLWWIFITPQSSCNICFYK